MLSHRKGVCFGCVAQHNQILYIENVWNVCGQHQKILNDTSSINEAIWFFHRKHVGSAKRCNRKRATLHRRRKRAGQQHLNTLLSQSTQTKVGVGPDSHYSTAVCVCNLLTLYLITLFHKHTNSSLFSLPVIEFL